MKKILVITDSLGLPRDTPELVKYEDTYFCKLKQKFPTFEFIPFMLGGGDLPTLYKYISFYYKATKPTIVILQSGIVDCAPRAFTRKEYAVIDAVRLVKIIFNSRLKPILKRLAKMRKVTNTTLSEYSKYVNLLTQVFPDSKILWNQILPASDEYETQLPGIKQNIKLFNRVLESNDRVQLISYNEQEALEGLMVDHHHLNNRGNELMFREIAKTINQYLQKNKIS